MENSEASKRAESENEPRYENLEVDVVDVDMVEVKPLIEIYTDLNETQKREALEKYRQRAILSRDARQTKREINTHNGKPCSGKACPGCTLCSEKAVYKNGKLEMSQLCKAKYEKYFSAEDERVYVHPDFYPSIKFEPKHNHCKKICCVCTRYPYLHGANKELVDSVHLKKNEPLSETCIKCKGVSFSLIPICIQDSEKLSLFRLPI